MPEFNEIVEILSRYPSINGMEENILNEWREKDQNEDLFQSLTNNENRISLLQRFGTMKTEDSPLWDRFYTLNFTRALSENPKAFWWRRWPAYVAAASIIIFATTIGFKWWSAKKSNAVPPPAAVVQKTDVQPGGYNAQLTLADGSVVDLDSFAKNQQIQQGSTNIVTKDGQLVYQPQGMQEGKMLYNTLSTAKGQMYSTVLADGSKVWLNSQSSIRYPVRFSQDRRVVEITGEAYFEVAHHSLSGGARQPFIVKCLGVEIEVLGTHFNINAYVDEESIKTTLLEGSVKITKDASSAIIKPGEQATVSHKSPARPDGRSGGQSSQNIPVQTVDVEEAVAWKNGLFQFNDADLKAVFNQIARWYDVEVIYQGSIPQKKFWGKISRSNTLLQVIEAIEKYGVHCSLEGRKLIVFL